MAHRPIEIENTVTFERLDHAIRYVRRHHDAHQDRVAGRRLQDREPIGVYRLLLETGIRAARNREGKLMKILEQGAEILGRESKIQIGGMQNPDGTQVEATDSQTWKNAYTQADTGGPDLLVYQLVYAAAAVIAGYAM